MANKQRSFMNYLRGFDSFAEPISFLLDGGSDRYSSRVGGVGLLSMYIFILTYSGMKIAEMAKGANTVTSVHEYDVFSQNDQQIMPKIAFGISSFPP
jgi:hypothetical protein